VAITHSHCQLFLQHAGDDFVELPNKVPSTPI